MHELVILCIN